MKRFIAFVYVALLTAALALIATACSAVNQADIDESIALESAQARLAQAESESESLEESLAARAAEAPHFTPTDEQKELICGDWYRSADSGDGDSDIYWLTMKETGVCTFAHETMKSTGFIDRLEGTWDVDAHDFVNIDLGKYKGKFRFLKNAYGSTNIICLDGDDFVESGQEGAYAAFVPVRWYRGKLRFVSDTGSGSDTDGISDKEDTAENVSKTDQEEDCPTAGPDDSGADAEAVEDPCPDQTDGNDTAYPGEADGGDVPADREDNGMIYVEMQGEGDSWFRLAAADGLCKIDTDTRDGEIPCRLAINQNDHLVVKIQQIRDAED